MQLVDMEAKARGILTGLGFEESMLSKPFSTLSGGWKMRCMLAAALTHTADIRILDEPTNYLDLLGIMWLQRYLISLSTTHPETILLLVSHDRAFIDAICSEVIILRDQKLTYFSGNLTSYEKDVKHQVLRMSRMKEAQDRQTAHMEKTVQNNIKIGKKTGDDNKLRQAKSRQKKIDDRMGLQVSATGGRFKLNRDLGGYHLKSRAEIEIPKEERGVQMVFPAAPELRHPGSLISLEKVAFSYPKAPKPIIVDIDLVIHMGDRIGLVGLNGVGKSSLVKLVVDETKPSKGTVSRHSRLKVGYYSQHAVEALQAQGQSEPTLTALTLFLRQFQDLFQEQQARQLLGSLGLAGRTASDVPIAKLSGGQLVRLALSLLLAAPPHLLVLDEISTHLDWQTVKALIGALADYDGAILLASHDRFMVRCVVEGHPADEEDGEDEEDEEDVGRALQRRRMVYQLKAGKLVERSGGMEAFEGSLEGRLKKMALI
jgi:ATPase subunit of ABC transporter with duplicated ATPase domains